MDVDSCLKTVIFVFLLAPNPGDATDLTIVSSAGYRQGRKEPLPRAPRLRSRKKSTYMDIFLERKRGALSARVGVCVCTLRIYFLYTFARFDEMKISIKRSPVLSTGRGVA